MPYFRGMKYRKFAQTDIGVSAIGLGCMVFNHGYGVPDPEGGIATMEKALDLGINFWDTADIYANGENEKLVSRVLRPNRSKVFLASKFGFLQYAGHKLSGIDGSPAYVRQAVEASLQRLGTDVIDLYYLHRVDPEVPVEETVGAMAELVREGKVRFLGLSEVSASTLKRAHAVHPISALQSEYSILSRDVEGSILDTCKALGVTFVPFSPLARGLMTNTLDLSQLADHDFRRQLPRYQQEHVDNNMNLARGFEAIAKGIGCSPAQLALAWLLSRGDNIVPIPGTKRVNYLEDNAGAVNVRIDPSIQDAIVELLRTYPDVGDRYNEKYRAMVDKD